MPTWETRSDRWATPPRRVLVVETDGGGHRLNYVRLIADAARLRAAEVAIYLGPGVAQRSENLVFLDRLTDEVEVTVGQQLTHELASAAKSANSDLIVIPDGDRWLTKLPLLLARTERNTRLSVLLMRDPWMKTAGLKRRAKACGKRLVALALRSSPRVQILSLSPAGSEAGAHQVTDPISFLDPDGAAQELVGLPELSPSCFWFGVLGAVDDRKNVDLVLDALRTVDIPRAGLIVAGRVAPSVMEHLDRARAHGQRDLVVVNRFLEPIELDFLVAAVGCVVLAHSNEGPSGILGKAMMAGTRVIAAGARSLRQTALGWPEGANWVELTREDLAGAMTAAMGMPQPLPRQSAGESHFADRLLGIQYGH